MPKLTTNPQVWFLECRYCNAQTSTNGKNLYLPHEQELLDKADKFCKKSEQHHFREYLISEFDTLDHAKLTEIGQIEVLNAVHDKTGCDCLTELSTQITEDLHKPHAHSSTQDSYNSADLQDPHTPHLPLRPQAANPVTSSPIPHPTPIRHNPPKASTMLDRLKIGPRKPSKS